MKAMNLPVRIRNPKSEIRNPKSERRRLFGPVAIATLLGISMPDTVRADVVTFAQFSQRTVSDLDFSYTNKGSGASFDSVGQGIPIYLAITSGLAPGLDRLESAHLFLTSSTTEATMSQTGGDLLLREHFTGLANSIQIVLDTPVNGKRNFL